MKRMRYEMQIRKYNKLEDLKDFGANRLSRNHT